MRPKGIRVKILLATLTIGVIAILATNWQAYQIAKKTSINNTYNHLTALRENKSYLIEFYFEQLRNSLVVLSESQGLIDAAREFSRSVRQLKKVISERPDSVYDTGLKNYYLKHVMFELDTFTGKHQQLKNFWPACKAARYLQYHYIVKNPFPSGKKDQLDSVKGNCAYFGVHEKFHPVLRRIVERMGYYDLFILDPETGDILYTCKKEIDFATNLLKGPYRNSNLADLFRIFINIDTPGTVRMVDFKPYPPSYYKPASFLAAGIFDGKKKVGVLMVQIPIDQINRTMTGNYRWEEEGMGKTGETYIVGSDFKMRNDSRFFIEDEKAYLSELKNNGYDSITLNLIKKHHTSILFQEVKTEAVSDIFHGINGVRIIRDYRDIPVLSSFKKLNIPDVNWGILAEIDEKEIFVPLIQIRNRLMILSPVLVLFIILLSWLVSRSIIKPLKLLLGATSRLRKGDMSARAPIVSSDEVGDLARSFNTMADELQKAYSNLNEKSEIMENLTSKLAKYLSPQVYRSIFSGKTDVKIEARRKKLTVFFSDIKGFTTITDTLESEALSGLLNHYFTEMSEIALRYGGTIDKYMGDAIMIFFGDPESKGEREDAIACVTMAIEMRERMKYLRKKWEDEGISGGLQIRIGINTGHCTVGNFGSENRLDYTIIGGTVNLASRLETTAEPDQILISYETYALVKDKIACEPKGEIHVKGIARAIKTFQVIGLLEGNLQEEKFIEQSDGFTLSLDMSRADKNKVTGILKKTLDKLKNSPDDLKE